MTKAKIRWGDTLDDEDALPPSTVKGPDSHGIKITTDYYKNDKGEALKKVTKVKVVNVEKKVYKVVLFVVAAIWVCPDRPTVVQAFSCPLVNPHATRRVFSLSHEAAVLAFDDTLDASNNSSSSSSSNSTVPDTLSSLNQLILCYYWSR